MTKIPTTPKRFRNWLDKQKDDLPGEVYERGIVYWFCLNMIEMNRNDSHAIKAIRRFNSARVTEFMKAYAAWKKQNLS